MPLCPIPPSLQASPLLTSPIFDSHYALPRLPTEEDELWLQDTIPLSSSSPSSSGTLPTLDDDDDDDESHSPQLPPSRRNHHHHHHNRHHHRLSVPLSPPITVQPPSLRTPGSSSSPSRSPLGSSNRHSNGAAPLQYPFPSPSYAVRSRPPPWTSHTRTRSYDSGVSSDFAARLMTREAVDIRMANLGRPRARPYLPSSTTQNA